MSIETVLVNLRKCVTPQSLALLHLSDPLGALLVSCREMADPNNRKIPQPLEGAEF